MTMTGWNESAEQARARWEAKHKKLTAAEIDRLSRPFPAGRTDAQREADLALVKKAWRIQLSKPLPAPRKWAAQAVSIGLATMATIYAVLFVIASLAGR